MSGINPILIVDNLVKRFGGLYALNKVNLDVKEGEILCLIGPNGSGKTTLVNVITGVYKPSEGKIIFNGTEITGLKPNQIVKLGISRTYQIPRPFLSMTVVENVLVAALYGSKKRLSITDAKKKAEQVLEVVGYPKPKWNMPIKNESYINWKLIEIARALSTDPKLIFLDEPFAGLNPTEVDTSLEVVEKIHKELKVTIVLIEHLLRCVKKVAQRVVVLNNGIKIAEGSFEEVINNDQVKEAYLGEERAT